MHIYAIPIRDLDNFKVIPVCERWETCISPWLTGDDFKKTTERKNKSLQTDDQRQMLDIIV